MITTQLLDALQPLCVELAERFRQLSEVTDEQPRLAALEKVSEQAAMIATRLAHNDHRLALNAVCTIAVDVVDEYWK